ncbi:MAG TPA: FGGY-family carbohydrate kinase [Acidisarcina sp.]
MSLSDAPSIVAIDLGAESCRVSLLRWERGAPIIELVYRFLNAPIAIGTSLHWDLDRILSEIHRGLLLCASQAAIASIGVDGWAVDYVRLGTGGQPISQPFCYRDARTGPAVAAVASRVTRERIFELSGVQSLPLNTMYQLVADDLAGVSPQAPWMNLPEFVLAHLGGRAVAEYSNATHTGLVDASTHRWRAELFNLCGLDRTAAPDLVDTGSDLGEAAAGTLSGLAAFRSTRLIAPACHDTASAIAGIALAGDDWAYISSGTWSLVGVLLEEPITTAGACAAGFTNLGAAGGRVCFHKNVNGMWLLKQTMLDLYGGEVAGSAVEQLIADASRLQQTDDSLEVDDPELLRPGSMASRINAQRRRRGLEPFAEDAASMPRFASLIFHSLARRYAQVLGDVQMLTGKKLRRVAIVGGGSRNKLLNRLTAEATGLEVQCGAVESSTLGNLSVQIAALEGQASSAERIAHWAKMLAGARQS